MMESVTHIKHMNASPRKMRVLILSVSMKRKGGVTNYLELLMKNIESDKIDIRHFSQGMNCEKPNALISPFVLLLQFVSFIRTVREFKPDVIHINPSLSRDAIIRDILFLRVAIMIGGKVLFFIHGWNEITLSALKERFFWKHVILPSIKKADGYVVLANQFKIKLEELGIPSPLIHVSSTMVEVDKYKTDHREASEDLSILFCANIVEKKGPYVVLDAAALLLKSKPRLQFVFIGDGPDLESLKQNAGELGIQANVRFTGFISLEEKIKEFQQADIFVFPSMYGEGFPTVILEAMAAGLPVITTPIAGLIDALDDGVQGYFIPIPPDATVVARKISKLCEDRKSLKRMSDYNANEALKKYDAHVVSSSIATIYREIAHEKR